jgi:hypothetical protein
MIIDQVQRVNDVIRDELAKDGRAIGYAVNGPQPLNEPGFRPGAVGWMMLLTIKPDDGHREFCAVACMPGKLPSDAEVRGMVEFLLTDLRLREAERVSDVNHEIGE